METRKIISRYASSNSFLGFKSYYKEIFDSEKFDYVFVIKGGPGCGKSSAMKKIAKAVLPIAKLVESLRCSSDINSLDGVIAEGVQKVGILDGTAPHERDAVIPGAVDYIWNFGDFLDGHKVKRNKSEILYLNKMKHSEYSKAYSELHFSYEYWINIKAEYTKALITDKIKKASDEICDIFKAPDLSYERRLVSSFSKEGYTYTSEETSDSAQYSIFGDKIKAALLCSEIIRKSKCVKTAFLSPLDPSVFEGFCGGNGDTLSIHSKENPILNAEDFFEVSVSMASDIEYLTKNMDMHLSKAQEHLIKASQYHASLEAIYSPCMDFDALSENVENCIKKIKNILMY